MILEQHNSEFVHIQKDFRESFRDSLAENPNAKFDTHWNAALTGQFGKNPPCGVSNNHFIFEDKYLRNYYYYRSLIPTTENAYIEHYYVFSSVYEL